MKYDCIYICWSVFIDNYMYKLKAEKPLFWKLHVAKETGTGTGCSSPVFLPLQKATLQIAI